MQTVSLTVVVEPKHVLGCRHIIRIVKNDQFNNSSSLRGLDPNYCQWMFNLFDFEGHFGKTCEKH